MRGKAEVAEQARVEQTAFALARHRQWIDAFTKFDRYDSLIGRFAGFNAGDGHHRQNPV